VECARFGDVTPTFLLVCVVAVICCWINKLVGGATKQRTIIFLTRLIRPGLDELQSNS
jgi:hypothetical protein